MESFIIEGGHPLKGTIVPQGAKNEALEVICTTILTKDPVRINPHVATRDLMKELERRGFVRASSYNSPKYPEADITLTVTLTHTNFTDLNELV